MRSPAAIDGGGGGSGGGGGRGSGGGGGESGNMRGEVAAERCRRRTGSGREREGGHRGRKVRTPAAIGGGGA